MDPMLAAVVAGNPAASPPPVFAIETRKGALGAWSSSCTRPSPSITRRQNDPAGSIPSGLEKPGAPTAESSEGTGRPVKMSRTRGVRAGAWACGPPSPLLAVEHPLHSRAGPAGDPPIILQEPLARPLLVPKPPRQRG